MFAPAPYHGIHIIAKYISGELEVTGFMLGNKSRFYIFLFIIMYVTGSTGKTEDRSKFLIKLGLYNKHNITAIFMKKMEYFARIQRSINPYISNP